MKCVNCGVAALSQESRNTDFLSGLSLKTLARWLKCEVPKDANICHQCYELLTLENPSHTRMFGHTLVCISCGCSCKSVQHHGVEKTDSMLQNLPKSHPAFQQVKNYACHTCWTSYRRQSNDDQDQVLKAKNTFGECQLKTTENDELNKKSKRKVNDNDLSNISDNNIKKPKSSEVSKETYIDLNKSAQGSINMEIGSNNEGVGAVKAIDNNTNKTKVVNNCNGNQYTNKTDISSSLFKIKQETVILDNQNIVDKPSNFNKVLPAVDEDRTNSMEQATGSKNSISKNTNSNNSKHEDLKQTVKLIDTIKVKTGEVNKLDCNLVDKSEAVDVKIDVITDTKVLEFKSEPKHEAPGTSENNLDDLDNNKIEVDLNNSDLEENNDIIDLDSDDSEIEEENDKELLESQQPKLKPISYLKREKIKEKVLKLQLQILKYTESLRIHRLSNKIPQKECNLCGFKGSTFKYNRIHVDFCLNPYTCTKCNQTYNTMTKYINHFTNHGYKNHECPHCNKSYGSVRELVAHFTAQFGIDYSKIDKKDSYSCRLCGSVVTKNVLFAHWEKHLPFHKEVFGGNRIKIQEKIQFEDDNDLSDDDEVTSEDDEIKSEDGEVKSEDGGIKSGGEVNNDESKMCNEKDEKAKISKLMEHYGLI